jgi:hypothetical protein
MTLKREIEKFRDWASNYPVAERSGEWECDYPDWAAIKTQFKRFIEQTDCNRWSAPEIQSVLYIIARDNECEILIDELVERRECFFSLVKAAVKCDEPEAKWQFASRLGDAEHGLDDIESYLVKFLQDSHEYVRRRALLALAQTGSTQTEAWAEIAWNTGDEYQRIAALHALRMVSSSRLNDFIASAKQDGRRTLVMNAEELST